MRILITPTFKRTQKKLHPGQKISLDHAVREIAENPLIGVEKVGDLAGVHVHKFRMANTEYLLAYRIVDAATVKLLMLGPHENFYRDLKRQGKGL